MVGLHTGPTIIWGLGVYGATGTAPRARDRGYFPPRHTRDLPRQGRRAGSYADRPKHSRPVRFHVIDASTAGFVVSLVAQQDFHIINARKTIPDF